MIVKEITRETVEKYLDAKGIKAHDIIIDPAFKNVYICTIDFKYLTISFKELKGVN